MAEDYYPDRTHEDVELKEVKLIQRIKPRTLLIVAYNLPANEDNIYGYFEDTRVSLEIATPSDIDNFDEAQFVTPAGYPGTNRGTVKSDENGRLVAKFTIPGNQWTGQRTIRLKSDSGLVDAKTTFFSMGLEEKWVQYIPSSPPSPSPSPSGIISYGIGGPADPIAQTFNVEKDMFLSSIDLWFHSVPSDSSNPVIMLGLRELSEDGYPKDEVIGKIIKTKSEIENYITSHPDNTNYVKFKFNSPVYLPKGGYAFTLAASVNGFTVFASEIGKQIIGSVSDHATGYIGGFPFPTGLRRILTSSAYPQGVLMRSSTESTWVPDHKRDLMFRINRAKFNTRGTFYMRSSKAVQKFSHFAHTLDTLIPNNTNIKTYYRLDTDQNYRLYLPQRRATEGETALDLLSLGKTAQQMDFKIELTTQDDYVSPVLFKNFNQLNVYWYEESGVYRTKEVSCDNFDHFYMWIDEKLNNGTATYKITFNSGSTWHDLPLISTSPISNGYTEKYLGGSVDTITSTTLETAQKFIIKIEFANVENYRYTSPEFRRLRVLTY